MNFNIFINSLCVFSCRYSELICHLPPPPGKSCLPVRWGSTSRKVVGLGLQTTAPTRAARFPPDLFKYSLISHIYVYRIKFSGHFRAYLWDEIHTHKHTNSKIRQRGVGGTGKYMLQPEPHWYTDEAYWGTPEGSFWGYFFLQLSLSLEMHRWINDQCCLSIVNQSSKRK